ncbi:ribosomal protein S18-alanine N-acetyltransferase [Sulfurisphaera tokodaii]|uniref:Acetyltransferase n=2 Tax=Sulfurisphaera tokodaii TaxID=111955 RepID=Q96YV0_SULTO|nr:ribosomal protein S18-alanine N-acetyltransferase [Sulfurisphaera tokodaii]BAB67176.1 putative acetyltransferase [Sulfurisphaera tokodaii str. 7]HII72908.1 ribosomal protein S18-alanine N-acetyltransferase [Sulfurisphaera tokodaii]
MIIITNVDENDLPKVYEVEVESFEDPYPYSLLKAYYYLSRELFLVAKQGDDIVGYSLGIIQFGYRGHVVSIAVKKDYREKGIGSLLLKELEKRFKEYKCTHSYLEVNFKNKTAIEFYHKLGYIIVKLQKNYYGRGKHAFIMVKSFSKDKSFE